KKVGGYNLMDLPGLEALQVPGLIWFRSNFYLSVRTGVPRLSRYRYGTSTMHSALLFDVDIGDGEPIRKLPYNRTGVGTAPSFKHIPKVSLLFLSLLF
ncbi:hypothetical protein B296_00024807, partial [Ensete ventricosum]